VSGFARLGTAHETAVDIDLWGNFGPETALCQRQISRAAEQCAALTTAIRAECFAQQLSGVSCDSNATDDQIEAVHSTSRDIVAAACSTPQLQLLRYADLDDATQDVVATCRTLETSMTSGVFAPSMVGGTVAAGDLTMRQCVNAARSATDKLLRFTMRTRRRVFDRIAVRDMEPEAKHARIARADRRIKRAQSVLASRLRANCPDFDFATIYGYDIDSFLGTIAGVADCHAGGVYLQDAVRCPAPVCGNGVQEDGEECDDGNDFDGDGCRSDCLKTECDSFASTYDLIQRAIFENRGCTATACHDSTASGGLDLRADRSYENLIDVPSQTFPGSGFKRIDPGNKDDSLLWINVAAGTLPDEYTAPRRAMPIGAPPLTANEVEALRLWIEEGGASRDGTVPGTADLLQGCLPQPKPLNIEPLPPPAANEGIQLHMPAWTLPPDGEAEVCFSSYYDFTGQIPPEFLSADGLRFRYREVEIRQDPLSHHLIVDLYRGDEAPNDPVWGTYTCKGGGRAGETCDPLDLGFCGEDGDCATDPDPTTIACIGFGPQTGFSTLVGGGFAFAQEAASVFSFPENVYDELPVRGVILWNSHGFNLTNAEGALQAWVNIYFPAPDEQRFPQQQIFNVEKIFWTDQFPFFSLPKLPPFEQLEVCHHHVFRTPDDPNDGFEDPVFDGDQTLHLFELSGHMHRHGKRFQIFQGRFSCQGGTNAGEACSPFNPEMCPEGSCTENTGRDAQESLLYTNFIYNDPVVLRFDEPLRFQASAPLEDRTLTYCALYDNGAPPNVEDVKRLSTSPPAGILDVFGLSLAIGGPCSITETRCIGGPRHNQLCRGDDSFCDSAPGAGDGDCDACPLTGGFRTEDEMFILFGNFWVD
jgi:cysteine-rich repeat protein